MTSAHIDDWADYVDPEEQHARERRDITDRVRLLERDFAFLDRENAELWQMLLDQQAEIKQLQYALLHDLVHQPGVEVITTVEELEDTLDGRRLVMSDDETEECNYWQRVDGEYYHDQGGDERTAGGAE